jgi:hypothetical protein
MDYESRIKAYRFVAYSTVAFSVISVSLNSLTTKNVLDFKKLRQINKV